ncbi:MAG TPA: hypothetical protein IAA57_02535 [Candidatus Pullilachnospira intestinigallinarum]|nr:hypothetical protein [Candidatus Pullilachnospira intestinigallinarum]
MAEKRYESDLTGKEKRHLEWEKIKGMTWKQRIGHIWTYYKIHMAVLIGILLVIGVIGQMIYNSQFDTIFQAAILNGGMGDAQSMSEDFKAYLGDDDKYHEIVLDSSMYFTGDESADMTSVMKLTTLIGAQELDAMICEQSQYDKYVDLDAFVPMDELLTQEQIQAYGDDVLEYAVRVDGSEKLQAYGLGVNQPAYLAVFVNSEHQDTAKEFISYLKEDENE